ncbi:UNKNOWN [Stylonychia lemnae]|uniref:Cadg domain containing protein n=1 Tax=Stylonychia lemnae TaxID=5949 RepID=A0A077ZRS6_STYLE|nr:UNKNOWN [Stylonychia lemnae]|eukprot:CDW71196.1 UNKNOWN [Stylonychia lemnae]
MKFTSNSGLVDLIPYTIDQGSQISFRRMIYKGVYISDFYYAANIVQSLTRQIGMIGATFSPMNCFSIITQDVSSYTTYTLSNSIAGIYTIAINQDLLYDQNHLTRIKVQFDADLYKNQFQLYTNTMIQCNQAGELQIKFVPDQQIQYGIANCIYQRPCNLKIGNYTIGTCQDKYKLTFKLFDVYEGQLILDFNNTATYLHEINVDFANLLGILGRDKIYNFKLRASYSVDEYEIGVGINEEAQFQFLLKNCDDYVAFLSNANLNNKVYYIGDPMLQWGFIPPKYSTSYCVNYLQYKLISEQDIHNLFLSLNTDNYQFKINTQISQELINTTQKITLQIKAVTLNNYDKPELYQQRSFRISLFQRRPQNSPPQFSQDLSDQIIMAGIQSKYTLPSSSDKEDNLFIVSMASTNSEADKFTQFDGSILTFSPSADQIGIFELIVVLREIEDQTTYSQHTFLLKVVSQTDSLNWEQIKKRIINSNPNLQAKIIKITNTGQVSIEFEQPLDYNPQTFYIIFIKRDYFYSADLSRKIPVKYKIYKQMPPQLSQGQFDLSSAVASTVQWTMGTVFGTSIFINLLLSQGAQYLWGMIEGFQLITHLPMMSIQVPVNTLSFFGLINDMASLNLIPTDDFNDNLWTFNYFDDQPYNNAFDFMNYRSNNLIKNLGLMLYMLFLNLIILFVSFSELGDIMASFLSIIIMLSIFILPIFSYLIVRCSKRENGKLDQRFQVCYDNLDLNKQYTEFYFALQMIRRILYSLIMVILGDHQQMQITMQIQLTFIVLLYLITVKPFQNQSYFKLVITNEFFYLIICYSFIPFVNHFYLDQNTGIIFGYIPIILVLIYLIYNSFFIVADLFHFIRRILRQRK